LPPQLAHPPDEIGEVICCGTPPPQEEQPLVCIAGAEIGPPPQLEQPPPDGIVPMDGIDETFGPPLHPLQPLEYGVPIMATGCCGMP
jgi:hypothetical protein